MERFEVNEDVERRTNMILKELAELPLEEVLSYALRSEEDAVRLYTMLSEKIEEPHAKMRFKQFIKSEEGHRKKVLRIFRELFPDREPSIKTSPTWVEISAGVEKDIKTVRDYLEVLEVALRSEKLAGKMYASLAESSANEEHRDIFLSLAEDEKRHYKFLLGQYKFYKRAKAEESLQTLIDGLLKKE